MGHKTLVAGNKLRDKRSGAELMTFEVNPDNKYYAAVVMCGHCGRSYFVPVLFAYWNKNPDEVKEIARVTPRTKRDHKEFILCMEEIDILQYRLIEHINDCDKFLLPSENGYSDDDSYERRIIMPDILNGIYDNEKRIRTKKDKQREFSRVKTPEDYPEHMILQRTFAPRIKKYVTETIVKDGKVEKVQTPVYEYPKKVKISDFIDDYFAVEVFKKGIVKRKITMLAMYYSLYGENNPLGIRYNDGVISFIDENGSPRYYEVHDVVKGYLRDADIGYKSRQKKEDPYAEIMKITGKQKCAVSQIEKFNKKLEKSNKMNKGQPSQPGDN